MKFKILAEDKKKGKIEIPVSFGELSSLWDLHWIICPDCIDCMKLNKFDKDFWNFCKKLDYLIDIKYDGKCYSTKEVKGKIIKKYSKEKYYLNKKPKWRK